jgi:hypothetical protein
MEALHDRLVSAIIQISSTLEDLQISQEDVDARDCLRLLVRCTRLRHCSFSRSLRFIQIGLTPIWVDTAEGGEIDGEPSFKEGMGAYWLVQGEAGQRSWGQLQEMF